MKKKVFVGIVSVGLIMGTMTVSAWTIPGVDRPFDPPNYYNPLTISVPDNAPSIFTTRDLAAQGYQVHDAKRNSKSIITDIKNLTEMLNGITSLVNDAKELISMSSEGMLTTLYGDREHPGKS